MTRTWIMALLAAALAATIAAASGKAEPVKIVTQADKESYGIGVGVARNFRNQGIDVELEVMIQGIRDAIGGGKLLMTEDELSATMTAYTEALRQKQVRVDQAAAQDNKKAGDAFLAANKGKPGVKALADGLQYRIIAQGKGNKPTDQDTVECSYRGTLVDGKEFDRSPTGVTASLAVASLIPGFREAVKLMTVGSKWQIVIPPELAYGQQRAGSVIGPSSTLIFEVELLGIK